MKCRCGRKAVYFKRADKQGYCKDCLIKSVEGSFRHTIGGHRLIKSKDTVAVGVSGGKDSMTLLYLMNKFFSHNEMFAITINEGIRGYRDESVKSIGKFSKRFGIEHHVFSFKDEFGITMDGLPKEKKPCTYCGVFRRYLLNKKSRELGANKLAVAHNLDDEAQSVILNFLRGDMSRFQRLGADPTLIEDEKFVKRIKPLRNIPEKETALYAVLNNLPFFSGECPYSYDNQRRDLQTMLNDLEFKYPGTKFQIVRFYDKIKSKIVEETKEKTKEDMNYCSCGEPTSGKTCRACQLLETVRKS
jgi:uncharacterized protein (TIGR00269 family)